MKAVLLCAGEGSRLRPFTFTQPKHLLPIVGIPLLTHTMNGLKEQGIKDFIIIVGHLEEKIREHYKDGKDFGINITYITQAVPEGTAQAIGLVEKLIDDEYFFVQYGDVMVSPVTYKDLFKEFEENGNCMMITGREVEDPSQFGVLQLDDAGNLIKIVEKPRPGEEPSKLANAGLYIFNRNIFDKIRRTKKSKRGEYEITDPIQMLIDDGEKIRVFKLPYWWKDIGLPWSLLEANKLILDELPDDVLLIKGTIEPGAVIHNRVGIGEGTIIRSGAYLKGPILIGKNCDIGPNCYIRDHTVIGNNVRIGHACEIKASLV
ncbi:MAG: bifunctional sugar-1-phosphate nucleotidylyltransferase/acetyltransferase, partial [Candidatus Helarchaeales archaeon]